MPNKKSKGYKIKDINTNQNVEMNHFLCNQKKVSFTEFFDVNINSFGSIVNKTLITNMLAISGKSTNKIPSHLPIAIRAGYQKPGSNKGISGRHIIERGHLAPFSSRKHSDPWQILIEVANQYLIKVNNIEENDIALAWAPTECAFVLIINTGTSFGLHQHILCTLYFVNHSLLMLGTLYTVPQLTAQFVTHGNHRYLPIPFNVSIPNGTLIQKTKWVIKNISGPSNANDKALIAPAPPNLTVMDAINQENSPPSAYSYNQLIEHFSKMSLEDYEPGVFEDAISYGELIFSKLINIELDQDEFLSLVMLNMNKYCSDIVNVLETQLDEIAIFHQNIKACNNKHSLLKEQLTKATDTIKQNKADDPDKIAAYFKKTFQELTIQLIELTSETEKLTNFHNEISSNKILEIQQQINKLNNKHVNSQLNEEMLVRWNNLVLNDEKCQNELATLVGMHDKNSSQLLFIKFAFLKPICHFLTKSLNGTLIPLQYVEFLTRLKTFVRDENLEEECKENGNYELFTFFINKLAAFAKKFPEIYAEFLRENNYQESGGLLLPNKLT